VNRERAKELLPVLQAYAEGKDIEFRGNYSLDPMGEWRDMPKDDSLTLTFPADDYEYRIKIKPLEVFMEITEKNGKVVGFHHTMDVMHQKPGITYKLFREVL